MAPPERSPGVGACLRIPNKDVGKTHHAPTFNKNHDGNSSKLLLGGELASLLPAIFLSPGFISPKSASPIGLSPTPDSCCTGEGCQYVHEYDDFEACYGASCSPARRVDPKLCSEAGACKTVDIVYRRCKVVEDGYNFWFFCAFAETTPCATATPTPTPSPSPSPSPSPTPQDCPISERPNDSNCYCADLPGVGLHWFCNCVGGNSPADYTVFPQNGGCDPTKSSNNGSNCCVCTNEISCASGSHWVNSTCQCEPDPASLPTPTPPGGTYYTQCTDYYWVLYECFPIGNNAWTCEEVSRWAAGCW
jgi:hypothetical protein